MRFSVSGRHSSGFFLLYELISITHFPSLFIYSALYNFPPEWDFMSFGSVSHFDVLRGDAFMKPSGRLFVSSPLFVHDILSSISVPPETHIRNHIYIRAITAATGAETWRYCLWAFCSFICQPLITKAENQHQPFNYGQVWQINTAIWFRTTLVVVMKVGGEKSLNIHLKQTFWFELQTPNLNVSLHCCNLDKNKYSYWVLKKIHNSHLHVFIFHLGLQRSRVAPFII